MGDDNRSRAGKAIIRQRPTIYQQREFTAVTAALRLPV